MENNIMADFSNEMRTFLDNIPTECLSQLASRARQELAKRKKAARLNKRRIWISSLDTGRYDDINKEPVCKNLLALIDLSTPPGKRKKYLKQLLSQDWSLIYPPDESDNREYYTYAHVNPGGKIFLASKKHCGGNYHGEPFYIGKGINNRAYDLKRNQGHGKMIKSVLSDGWRPTDIVQIIFSNLSNSKALEIESKLIYFFGSIYQKDRKGILYNLDIPIIPHYTKCMEKIKHL